MARKLESGWEIYECSPEAKDKILNDSPLKNDINEDKPRNARYPFLALGIGECFIIPFSEFEENTKQNLRASISYYHKNVMKKFCMISHKDHLVLEIARIG